VLSLSRLGDLEPVDDRAGQITVGAGVALAGLQRAAADAGWSYGVDIASRDSATVGGTVATNAGGLHVIRYGATRAQLLGLEAVLGTGAVVSHLGGLVKDNTMYVQAGVGVVADSDLEAEYQESIQKARALVRAAEEAVRFASAGQWSAGNTRR